MERFSREARKAQIPEILLSTGVLFRRRRNRSIRVIVGYETLPETNISRATMAAIREIEEKERRVRAFLRSKDLKALLLKQKEGDAGIRDSGTDGLGRLVQKRFEIAAGQEGFIEAGHKRHPREFTGKMSVSGNHVLTEDFYLLILTALPGAKGSNHRQRPLIST